MDKTNVMRALERAKISYTPHEYDASDGKIDGVSVANKVGLPPASVFKTLVTRAHGGAVLVFVIPVERELDLKKAARAAAVKSVEMLRQSYWIRGAFLARRLREPPSEEGGGSL